MAWSIEREQSTWVGHRRNFVGRSASYNTVAWDYEGRTWVVERPDDGEPARRCSVRCRVCRRTLTYAVHSLAATRRRRTRRWIATVVCLVAAIPLFGLATVAPNSVVVLSIAIGGGALALILSFSLMLVAAREVGLAGHGSALPGYTKHRLFLRSSIDGNWV